MPKNPYPKPAGVSRPGRRVAQVAHGPPAGRPVHRPAGPARRRLRAAHGVGQRRPRDDHAPGGPAVARVAARRRPPGWPVGAKSGGARRRGAKKTAGEQWRQAGCANGSAPVAGGPGRD